MTRFKLGLFAYGLTTAALGLAMRKEWVPREPRALALAVAGLLLGCLVLAGLTFAQLVTRRVPVVAGLSLFAALAGVVTAGGAGLANWAYSLQGALLLFEGDIVPLAATSHFVGLDVGPLADVNELGLSLQLEKVDLAPRGPDAFSPVSHLRLEDRVGAATRVDVTPQASGSLGPLRFHQGAFGFAPELAITLDGGTVFHEKVPFLTERVDDQGLRFARRFTVEKQGLDVTAAVDLSGMDERMKGHARLELEVLRNGQPLGRGGLRPGHFADLGGGYRLGFVGLGHWSEVMLSRRTYGSVLLAGAALAGLGAVSWLLAWVAGRRRRA